MPLNLEWDRPLRYRRGATQRLGGLEVYYDFDWCAVFQHDRAVFPGGQSLSELVRRDCPEGKRPALLLTERDEIPPRIEETSEQYVVIVPIRDYLRGAGADAATTYYARLSGTPLTKLPTLAEVNFFTISELESFLDKHLTRDALANWAAGSSGRLELLREIADEPEGLLPQRAAAALRSLSVADVRVLDEMVAYLERFGSEANIRDILNRLTQSEDGRVVTARVLAERLSDRISDTREQLDAYQRLIASPGATETDIQRFLEHNPWIVGLPYVRARARAEIPRGKIDFVLDRYDGFFDIVELKGPDDVIVADRGEACSDRPSSASAYSLGPALAKALAQAHYYRSILDQCRELHQQYGLSDSRQPRIMILLGRSTDLSASGREILRQLNLTLHRVEVIPYDLLGCRTAGLLNNIEELLGAADSTKKPTSGWGLGVTGETWAKEVERDRGNA